MFRMLLIVVAVLLAAAAGALVYAQLSDSQTASGTVSVTTTSPQLYLCEPPPGFASMCGDDDSGPDEVVFEGPENLARGQRATYYLLLKNVGTDRITVTSASLSISETSDPGSDCLDSALVPATNDAGLAGPTAGDPAGIFRYVDTQGDDVRTGQAPAFPGYGNSSQADSIVIDPNYADIVQLTVGLSSNGTVNCDGNEWNVAWNFEVG